MSIDDLLLKLHKNSLLTPIRHTKNSKGGHAYWLTRCTCGIEKEILQTHLINGQTLSCGCIRNIVGKGNPKFTGHEDVTGDYVASLRIGAKRRNLDFNLTAKEIWEQYIKQGKKCALSGELLQFGALSFAAKELRLRPKQTASVDRIIADRGYHKDNIQIIHSKINLMKNLLQNDEFIHHCIKVAEFNNTNKFMSNIKHDEMVRVLVKPGSDILRDLTPEKAHILHMAVGVSGEAGELLDAIKKNTVYCKELDVTNVIEELGDLEFYMEGIRQGLNITREQTLEANIEKLGKRYAGLRYSNQAAIDRADKD